MDDCVSVAVTLCCTVIVGSTSGSADVSGSTAETLWVSVRVMVRVGGASELVFWGVLLDDVGLGVGVTVGVEDAVLGVRISVLRERESMVMTIVGESKNGGKRSEKSSRTPAMGVGENQGQWLLHGAVVMQELGMETRRGRRSCRVVFTTRSSE